MFPPTFHCQTGRIEWKNRVGRRLSYTYIALRFPFSYHSISSVYLPFSSFFLSRADLSTDWFRRLARFPSWQMWYCVVRNAELSARERSDEKKNKKARIYVKYRMSDRATFFLKHNGNVQVLSFVNIFFRSSRVFYILNLLYLRQQVDILRCSIRRILIRRVLVS